jgi:hypothetical protein
LFTECLWFFHPIFANCSAVVPYFSMCSRPALPKNCGAGGAFAKPRFSIIAWACLSMGLTRSVNLMPSDPFSIFSKPRASAQSARSPSMNCLAMKSAVEPVAQLLLTL